MHKLEFLLNTNYDDHDFVLVIGFEKEEDFEKAKSGASDSQARLRDWIRLYLDNNKDTITEVLGKDKDEGYQICEKDFGTYVFNAIINCLSRTEKICYTPNSNESLTQKEEKFLCLDDYKNLSEGRAIITIPENSNEHKNIGILSKIVNFLYKVFSKVFSKVSSLFKKILSARKSKQAEDGVQPGQPEEQKQEEKQQEPKPGKVSVGLIVLNKNTTSMESELPQSIGRQSQYGRTMVLSQSNGISLEQPLGCGQGMSMTNH